MAEKEKKSALEMAASIGSNPSEIGQNWLALDGINIASVLKDVGKEIGISDNVLAQFGLWMADSLDKKIAVLQEKTVEQATAIELRKMFGVPMSLLAMPVFVELERMELDARADLKQESSMTMQIWEEIKNRLLYMIQLFLAEQIELTEKENLAHQAALAKSKKEAEDSPGLSETISELENKFKLKIEELEKYKLSLLDGFLRVKNNVVNSIETVFETTVFSASNQNLGATTLR